MFAVLWFLIRLGAVGALGAWLIMQPGRTQLEWLGYDIDAQTGLLLFIAFLAALVFAWLYQLWVAIKRAPRTIARHLDARAQDNALAALSQGLSAIAAGDTKMADKQAARAAKLMRKGGDHGLVALLNGMNARLKGDMHGAEAAFKELLETKETSFIGVRGLLQIALDKNARDEALVLARQAHRMHPKQAWIAKTLYALELNKRNWESAQDLLQHMVRDKTASEHQKLYDKAAISLVKASKAEADKHADQAYFLTRDAYKSAPDFLPAALAYLPYLLRRDERRAAIKLIEKTWAHTPHPALEGAWKTLAPEAKKDGPAKLYNWLEKLAKTNPEHDASHLMLAAAALEHKLLGEARTHTEEALGIRESQAAHRMLAAIEEAAGNTHAAAACREAASSAAPARAWVCTITGRLYNTWMGFAPPHNAFNTIVWDDPSHVRRALTPKQNLSDAQDGLALIEAANA